MANFSPSLSLYVAIDLPSSLPTACIHTATHTPVYTHTHTHTHSLSLSISRMQRAVTRDATQGTLLMYQKVVISSLPEHIYRRSVCHTTGVPRIR